MNEVHTIIGDLTITLIWAVIGFILMFCGYPLGFVILMGAVFYLMFSGKVHHQTSYLKQIADFYRKIDKEARDEVEKEEEEVEVGKFAIGPFRPDQMPMFIEAIQEALTNPHVRAVKTHSAPVVCDNCGHGFCLNCEARIQVGPPGNKGCPKCGSWNHSKRLKTEEGE